MFSHVSVEFKSFEMFIEILNVLHLISSFSSVFFFLYSLFKDFLWFLLLITYFGRLNFIVVSELMHEFIFLSNLEKL